MKRSISTRLGEVVIRSASPSDANSFRELRLEALKNHPTAFGSDYEESAARPKEHWMESLNYNDEKEALFFADYQNQLIGMTGIYRSLSRKARHSATIWGVYVKPDWRGRHIAEKLIQSCLDWAIRQNVVIVKLAVVADNKSAIQCYERCGFAKYGIEPKAICYENKYYDEILMACSLN